MSLILSGTNGLSDVDGSAATPAIRGTDTDTGIFFPAANTLAFSTNGTEDARFDPSGNFGLGVTPSAWASGWKVLQIADSSISNNAANDTYVGANFYFDGTNTRYIGSSFASYYGQVNGQHQFFTAASGTAGNVATFTQAMTLDAGGNLGIGTTSPSAKLEVNGSSPMARIFATQGTVATLRFSQTNVGNCDVYVPANTSNLAFSTNAGSTQHMTLDSSGNLLVGVTSTINSAAFCIQKSVSNNIVVVNNTASSAPYGYQIRYSGASPNSTGFAAFEFYDNPSSLTLRAEIRSNGGIANYSANNVNLSDRREKTNFAPAGDYLAKICAIPVQTFNYIDQNLEEDDGLTLGVVAQDVQAVAPELVMESNWAGKDEEPKMRLSIYQTDLQYALMKCIQEQQAIIEQLRADVAALKGQA